ncbi:protein FRIGIDA-ESSENTIAL 1 isoform X4 [Jatropha curcas]|nr:protein FRIGIDA-ESSENTIAL 1 isoform X4 [Jatropha curcas]
MEFQGNDRQQIQSCSPLGKSDLGIQSNSLVEDSFCNLKFSGSSNEQLTLREESHVNDEDSKCLKSREHLIAAGANGSQESVVKDDAHALMIKKNAKVMSEPHSDGKAHLCNSEDMAAETTSSSSIVGHVSNAFATKDCSDMNANGILDSKVKPMEISSEDGKERTTTRLVNSDIRTRSLSFSAEFKDQNKRPAVICDFFAKGWCIRGSSCRFLHIKSEADNAKKQLEEDATAAIFSKGDQFNEGLRNIMEKSKLPDFPDLKATPNGNCAAISCHFSSERILALENGENRMLHQLEDEHKFSSLKRKELSHDVNPDTQQFPSSKDDLGISSSLKDVGTENFRHNCTTTDYGSYTSLTNKYNSPSFQNNFPPENRASSSGSAVTSINYRGVNPSSYLSSLDNLRYIRDKYVNGSSFDGSFSSSGMFPSHLISAWTGPSFSFSSSLNTSPLGSQKLLDSDRDFRASRSSSLLHSASPLSGPERENLPMNIASRDPLNFAEHKAKVSSNDWEPSVPFRPSFFITHTISSSPGSQYDPLHDSIDLPTAGYKIPFKFSFVSHRMPSLDTLHQPAHGNSSVSRSLGPEHNADKSTLSFHSRFHENVSAKNCYTTGTDMLATGTVVGETCVVDAQKGTTPNEENASSTGERRDIPDMSKVDADHDSSPRHQNDGPRHKKDSKVDKVKQKREMVVDQKIEGESRAVRHFRAALVDFVKELLKPTWREGHLSKDAHNTIVKKAVEKVLSTLQLHQIPTTMESIKQYLSSSQPKIAKLVEGYCTKYGKS